MRLRILASRCTYLIWLGFLFLLQTHSVAAGSATNFGLETAAQGTGVIEKSLPLTIAQFIQVVLSIVGIIFLILVIWGGMQWMLAGGNEQSIDKAKKIITGATIGLGIILAAYAITYFIIESLTIGVTNMPTDHCDPLTDPNC